MIGRTGQVKYVSAETGNTLVRKRAKFFFRGKTFPGLVDEETGALYDDPENSFCQYVGIKSSLEKGLIRPVELT